MKRIFLLLSVCLLLSAAAASAQEPAPPRIQGPMTIERISNPFVITPEYKITDMHGETGQLVGASAGVVFDEAFFVGGGGYWLAHSTNGTDMWYGGAIIGWRPWTGRTLGVNVQGLAGFGQATQHETFVFPVPVPLPIPLGLNDRRGAIRYDGRSAQIRFTEDFVVFEPQVDLTAKLMSRVGLHAGVGYRLTGSDRHGSDSIDGTTGTLGLQIKW